jgi:hypothetical protein
MTSIVGYVAVQDLTKASDIIRSRTFDAFFPLVMVAVLYFLIASALLRALGYLERVTDPHHRRRRAGARAAEAEPTAGAAAVAAAPRTAGTAGAPP